MKISTDLKLTDQSDQFMATRKILLSGDIDSSEIQDAARKVLLLNQIDEKSDITIIVDSFGGEVYEALMLVDLMDSISNDVGTVVMGKAMSSGFLIATCGCPGKRFITPYATMMEHQISSAAMGNLSDLEDCVRETKRLEATIESIYKKRTKLPDKVIKSFRLGEVYFDAKQAVKYKIMDKITRSV